MVSFVDCMSFTAWPAPFMTTLFSPHRDLFEDDEVQHALRWRRAILALSDCLVRASQERSDLAAILSAAMEQALERLLVHGDERELMLLEHWLDEESAHH